MTKVRITCEGARSRCGAFAPESSASTRVLAVAKSLTGGNLETAVAWYTTERLAPFDHKTAETLVTEGRADDVIDFLGSCQVGFVG